MRKRTSTLILTIHTCTNIYFKKLSSEDFLSNKFNLSLMAQWVRALAPQTEGWVFESQPRQT